MKNKTTAQSWAAIRPKATRCQLGPLGKTAQPALLGRGTMSALGAFTARRARRWRDRLRLPDGQDVNGNPPGRRGDGR
jgi:hypothetical protein